jgi:hypothetical protein
MKPVCKSAAEALAESPIASLLDRARLVGQLTATVDAICRGPTVAQDALSAPRCTLEGGIAILTVGNPSQAAKLRQRAGQIIQALQYLAPEVTGIRVRLQPGDMNYPMPGIVRTEAARTAERSTDRVADVAAATRFADDLAEKLRDSPLRDAALRLQKLLRNRAQRTR